MNIGVIFAGGVGERMCSKDKPKQFLRVFNKPIIIHTIEVFQKNSDVDAIVIACHKDYLNLMIELKEQYKITKVKKIVPGGETGQLSIYAGLCAAREVSKGKKSIVLIHDGVRPMINSALLTDNISTVIKHGSCITGGIVKETIVMIDDYNNVQLVPPKTHSRVAKAPQSFWLDDILSAHEKALENKEYNYVDSCTLMNHYGFRLHMIEGPNDNFKITTPDDFFTMRAIMEARENEQIYIPDRG